MLRELYIKNMILIDELRIQFGEGLNVLTGETGTGKSIIVDCLELLIGERFNSEVIRNPDEKCLVEGLIDIRPDSPLITFLRERDLWEEGEDQLIIRREIGPHGRAVNRVNGRTVTASVLKGLGEYLIDIHLQNDNQQVLNPRFHLHFLDSLSPAIRELAPRLADVFQEWKEIGQELRRLEGEAQKRSEDLDYMDYQIAEIEAAALIEGEDDELTRERTRIMSSEKIFEALSGVDQLVFGDNNSAILMIARAGEALRGLEDDFVQELASVLNEVYYSLEDAGQRLTRFREGLEFDPVRLDLIEGRLQLINKLKRKYGGTITGVLEHLASLKIQRSSLQQMETRGRELEARLNSLWSEYEELARQVSELRQETSRRLEERIQQELSQLCMPEVRFAIEIRPSAPSSSGKDEAVFLFSANPGEPPRSLSRIASGGESSRFILALKTALAEAYRVPILIFDEIDVGVGGQALLAMGAKLRELSGSHQVILVTHSPQIASLADTHLQLRKVVEDGLTRIAARELDYEARVEELSRMLAGDNADAIATEHARQMLRMASNNR